ncbi:MAG: LLM class F420-dependent oxidoreductase, partial [Ilumatobacteraceae bacterium]
MIETSPVAGNSPDGIVFGVFAPQGWKMELSGIDGASAKWDRTVRVATLADELGYDSIWLY